MVDVAVAVPAEAVARLGGDARIDALARRAAAACEAALRADGAERFTLALTFVGGQRMRALNRAYRGIDRATDVLSFSQREGLVLAQPEGPAPEPLGDVVVALTVAARQARAFGHSLEREAAFLAVHGTLHLLGYDHETTPDEARMMGRAEAVLGPLGLGRDA
jgi:probable rRNA maturation factor